VLSSGARALREPLLASIAAHSALCDKPKVFVFARGRVVASLGSRRKLPTVYFLNSDAVHP
jgi:hypothetical protein